MPIQVTMKQIKRTFERVYTAGYCELQTLLAQEEPVFYCAGIYGKNCDVYIFPYDSAETLTRGAACIATGPRAGLKNRIPAEICADYDKRADALRDLWRQGFLTWDEMEREKRDLIIEMIAGIEKEAKKSE